MSNIFDNEISWMFIAGAVLGCVGLHSCGRSEQEAEKTRQVEARAKADVEIARIHAGLSTNDMVKVEKEVRQ